MFDVVFVDILVTDKAELFVHINTIFLILTLTNGIMKKFDFDQKIVCDESIVLEKGKGFLLI